MRIIKSTEVIPVEHPVFALFGQPGIGKTSLGYSTQRPLLLDFDKGAHRAANRRDTLVINAWEDVNELMANTGELDAYDTIVTDTVGRCIDMMAADIMAGNAKMGNAGNLSLQGYGVLKARFRTWISQLRALGKDVLLIAHDKEESDGDNKIVRLDITGGSYNEVMKVADFVGYVYMDGRQRVLDFNPTHKWVGKNPAGWKPMPLPLVGKAQDFMADLIDKGRDALGQISEASARIAAQVDEWRAAVESYTTPEECTRAIPEIGKLPAVAQPQVKTLLMAHARGHGFTFDTKAKAFVAPAPVPAAQPEQVPA